MPISDYWNMMVDELSHVDEERLVALERLIRQKDRIARYHNKGVRRKTFQVGDLVWKAILPIDQKLRKFGKWSPNWEGPFDVVQAFSNNAYLIRDTMQGNRTLAINGQYLKKFYPAIHEVRIQH